MARCSAALASCGWVFWSPPHAKNKAAIPMVAARLMVCSFAVTMT
jgi:hypothetical protein